jgi:hypothetical protein
MLYKKMSLEEALELESESLITLYDISPESDDTQYHPRAIYWQQTYQEVLHRFRQYSPGEVTRLLNCNFRIEILEDVNPVTGQHTWRYLLGKITSDLEKFNQYHSKGRYVYVLTNSCNKDIVKIGKAVNPLRRLSQINGPGVFCEWKLFYSLPVENDYLLESAIHTHLSEFRRTTDQGSSREFFEVTPSYAVEIINRLGAEVKTGVGMYYE